MLVAVAGVGEAQAAVGTDIGSLVAVAAAQMAAQVAAIGHRHVADRAVDLFVPLPLPNHGLQGLLVNAACSSLTRDLRAHAVK